MKKITLRQLAHKHINDILKDSPRGKRIDEAMIKLFRRAIKLGIEFKLTPADGKKIVDYQNPRGFLPYSDNDVQPASIKRRGKPRK